MKTLSQHRAQLLALVKVLPDPIHDPIVELHARHDLGVDRLGLDLLLRREGLAERVRLRGTCTIAKLCTTRVDALMIMKTASR